MTGIAVAAACAFLGTLQALKLRRRV